MQFIQSSTSVLPRFASFRRPQAILIVLLPLLTFETTVRTAAQQDQPSEPLTARAQERPPAETGRAAEETKSRTQYASEPTPPHSQDLAETIRRVERLAIHHQREIERLRNEALSWHDSSVRPRMTQAEVEGVQFKARLRRESLTRRVEELRDLVAEHESSLKAATSKLGYEHPSVVAGRKRLHALREAEAAARVDLRRIDIDSQAISPLYATGQETGDLPSSSDSREAALANLVVAEKSQGETLMAMLAQLRQQRDSEVTQLKSEIAAGKAKLAALQKQLQQVAQAKAKQQPPIEGAATRIYPLKYVAPQEIVGAIDNLLGGQALRTAVDERTNSLIVMAKPEDLENVGALVQNLDTPAKGEASDENKHVTRIFVLRNLSAESASETVRQLMADRDATLAISVAGEGNALIVAGAAAQLEEVGQLLDSLDQLVGERKNDLRAADDDDVTRSLMLRLFWLADESPEGEGDDPSKYLPSSVLKAVKPLLGIDSPRLVAQASSSIAAGPDEAAEFVLQSPVKLHGRLARMRGEGFARIVGDNRVLTKLQLLIDGPGLSYRLEGSLSTDLGHYAVLGSSNALLGSDAANYDGGYGGEYGYGDYGGGYGRGDHDGGGYGRAARGRAGRGEQGYGAPSRGDYGGGGYGSQQKAGDSANEEGESTDKDASGESAGSALEREEIHIQQLEETQRRQRERDRPEFATSRIALVVQVIEGTSFSAEHTPAGGAPFGY